MNRVITAALGASFLFVGGLTTAVAANTITLEPAHNMIMPHDTFSLDLYMDFSGEPTLGGALDVNYDTSMLMFDSFVFNEGWGDDASFRNDPADIGGGEIDGLNFGNFGGISGPAKVGTFTFTSTGMLGDTMVTPRDYDGALWTGFIADVTFEDQLVDYSGAMVHVVPEMEVWAMMLAGMGLLGWKARRSQQRKENDEALPA